MDVSLVLGWGDEDAAVPKGIITSTFIGYDFPDYSLLIPEDSKTKLVVNKEDFLLAVSLAKGFAADSNNLIVLEYKDGKLIMESQSLDGSHKSTRDCSKAEGPDVKVGVSVKFLHDAITKIVNDNIKVWINGYDSIVMLYGGAKYSYGIMPMHIIGDDD